MTEFNFEDVFQDEISSTSLSEGVHENVKLLSVDINKRKDYNGNTIKKQLFLKFKKYNKDGEDVGEKEISFFLLDTTKEAVVRHLRSYVSQVFSILTMYYTEDELLADEGDNIFDPFKELYDPEIHEIGAVDAESDFSFDNIKSKVLKKGVDFKAIEKAVNKRFFELVEDKIGSKSQAFRLKLEESSDGKYIQIPLYSKFIEREGVEKGKSELYN